MTRTRRRSWFWLAAVVVAHFAISAVHGAAHTGAHVEMSRAGTLFVFVVILAAPFAGLALAWPAPRAGSLVIAASMAASLAFGVVNHFLLNSADHVAHVEAGWRPMFATTAVLLAVTELIGAGLALAALRGPDRSTMPSALKAA